MNEKSIDYTGVTSRFQTQNRVTMCGRITTRHGLVIHIDTTDMIESITRVFGLSVSAAQPDLQLSSTEEALQRAYSLLQRTGKDESTQALLARAQSTCFGPPPPQREPYEYFILPKKADYRSPLADNAAAQSYMNLACEHPLTVEVREALRKAGEHYLQNWNRFQQALDDHREAFFQEKPQFRTAQNVFNRIKRPFKMYLCPILETMCNAFTPTGAPAEVAQALQVLNRYLSEVLGFYTYPDCPKPGEKPGNEAFEKFDRTDRIYDPDPALRLHLCSISRLPYCIEYPVNRYQATGTVEGAWSIFTNNLTE